MYNPVKILSQSKKEVSTTTEKAKTLSPSSTPADMNSPSMLTHNSSIGPDTKSSIPNTTDSIPDTTNSIPDSIPVSEVMDSVPTDNVESNIKPNTITPSSGSDTANPDPILETPNQENTEFIDYLKQPQPVKETNNLQRRDTEPRRAAASFSISGADPIISSGDHAIDSDDVVIVPEATEDEELEISYLVHDWIDKVRIVYCTRYVCGQMHVLCN